VNSTEALSKKSKKLEREFYFMERCFEALRSKTNKLEK
jgi:hypothetical protein